VCPTSSITVMLYTVLAAVGVSVLVGLYASTARPAATDRLVLCATVLGPAAVLAFRGSPLLVDYLLVTVAINRLLRRLLDWGEGRYDTTSLISLLPLAIAALMMLTILQRWSSLPAFLRRTGWYWVAAMAYGTGIGVIGWGLPAIYGCAEYVTPLIVLFYCVSLRPAAGLVQRWATVLGTLGVLLGVYGIYQWTDPPPWDAQWVLWSGMFSSMGPPVAYTLSICSTLESRGPAAMFFAVTAAALVALPALRSMGGIFVAAVPVTGLLLTQARTGLIYLVITLVASALFARNRGGVKIIFGLLVVGGVTTYLLGRQAQSSAIFDRVGTLGNLQDDGSANGRVGIATMGLRTVVTNPLGFGFGSGGNAIKAAAAGTEGTAVGDNGYLEILSILGVPGTLLYGIGFAMIGRQLWRRRNNATALEPTTILGLGLLVAVIPTTMVANQLTTAHASYMWLLMSRHLMVPSRGQGKQKSILTASSLNDA
jgi:O-antigen ligase